MCTRPRLSAIVHHLHLQAILQNEEECIVSVYNDYVGASVCILLLLLIMVIIWLGVFQRYILVRDEKKTRRMPRWILVALLEWILPMLVGGAVGGVLLGYIGFHALYHAMLYVYSISDISDVSYDIVAMTFVMYGTAASGFIGFCVGFVLVGISLYWMNKRSYKSKEKSGMDRN